MRGVVKLGASPVRRVDPATIARQVLMKAAVRGEGGGDVKLGASPVRRVDPATIARQVLMKAAVRGEGV